MSRELTYSLKIGWSGKNSATVLVIGSGLIGTGQIASGQFNAAYTGPYDDVTADVKSFKVTRGRDNTIDAFNMGEMNVTLWDRTGAIPNGKYNPFNAASPLFGMLRPMRPCQLTATLGANTYGLFNGWLADGQDDYDWDKQEATYHFVDLYDWLQAQDGPVIAALGATTTGAAISAVLQAIGWPTTLMRLDTGDILLDFSADGTKSALQLIQDLLAAERGVFFFSGDGYATYQDRNHWARKTAYDYQIQLARGVLPGFDIKTVINRARVTRTNLAGAVVGVMQEYIDAGSRAEFGIRSPGNGTIQTPFVSSDTMAANLAAYIVGNQKDPNNRIWNIEMIEDTVDTRALVASDIGAWINLQTQGAVGDYTLERIEVSGGGGALHSVKWGLSQRPTNVPLIIGSGQIGTGTLVY